MTPRFVSPCMPRSALCASGDIICVMSCAGCVHVCLLLCQIGAVMVLYL